jgi:hypothetical protein
MTSTFTILSASPALTFASQHALIPTNNPVLTVKFGSFAWFLCTFKRRRYDGLASKAAGPQNRSLSAISLLPCAVLRGFRRIEGPLPASGQATRAIRAKTASPQPEFTVKFGRNPRVFKVAG